MPTNPIDPRAERYALTGQIVTMNANSDVLKSGTVYVDNGIIAAVQPADQPPPAGFEVAPVVETDGTIFPGLIELHNHLSYDILPLWNVPETFQNRAGWMDHPEKRQLVTAPMYVLGHTSTYPEAVARYVECKCLLSGVTTSQGIALNGVHIDDFYYGLVRNAESPDDSSLPRASTKISDVTDVESFWERLQHGKGCFLLHLCEGIDSGTLKYFNALQLPDGGWAINDKLAGIHAAALHRDQFDIMASHHGAMIWSPLSNLLLYGQTADIGAAVSAGILIGLGSDWSPTGSKNLLCEMKVAALVAEARGIPLTSRDIVAMVTTNAARILGWQDALGSIEATKQADLLVIQNHEADPYAGLIAATEQAVSLVAIRGIPRYGTAQLMQNFAGQMEAVTVHDEARLLNLQDGKADPATQNLTLGQATAHLQEGLQNLAALAKQIESGAGPSAQLALSNRRFNSLSDAYAYLGLPQADLRRAIAAGTVDSENPPIFLDLDEADFEGFSPKSDRAARALGYSSPSAGAAPYSEILASVTITLDPLTVVDDKNYFTRIQGQRNLPDYVKTKLPPLYGAAPQLSREFRNLRGAPQAVRALLLDATDLPTYLHLKGFLTLQDRQLLAQQALLLLESAYVHLPMKRSMYAVDPVQRLRLVLFELAEQGVNGALPEEMDFHREMLSVFTSLHDLHTTYSLPFPFRDKVAVLPFLIEECFDEAHKPHYIVTKVMGNVGSASFKQNVEVLYWNGMPIKRAIEVNAARHAGSNPAASFARGLDSLTIRPLTYSLPPDEEWVTIRCRAGDGKVREFSQKWLVITLSQAQALYQADGHQAASTAIGIDWHGDAIQKVKSVFYAPEAVRAARRAADSGQPQPVNLGLDTTMPTVFRAQSVQERYGYIRIFTFNVDDADAFVDEFVRLLGLLPKAGLIIDVRNNGGGLIYAAERLLQVLTPLRPIEPSRAQFINSSLIFQLCNLHSPSTRLQDFDLSDWKDSVRQSVRTGASHSQGIPITDPESCNRRKCAASKVVLIVDALCYSATDIFAAGFQDHRIGKIIGVADNTGAGGANVWDYELLQYLMTDPASTQEPVFKPLPHGADMRVAIRRTLRVREQAGNILEDLGVRPDCPYSMTRDDLINGNVDLINFACGVLDKS